MSEIDRKSLRMVDRMFDSPMKFADDVCLKKTTKRVKRMVRKLPKKKDFIQPVDIQLLQVNRRFRFRK